MLSRPAGPDVFKNDPVDVESWELAEPLPEVAALLPHAGSGPLDAIITSALASRQGLTLTSEAMYCVAREEGRFYLAHGGPPTDPLRLFIAGRCGAQTSHYSMAYQHGQVPEGMPDEAVLEQWGAAVRQMVDSTLHGQQLVGGWYGRSNGQAIVMWVYGERSALMEPVHMLPSDGKVLIRGELMSPVEHVFALINRGQHGYAQCALRPETRLPRFEIECLADPKDERAVLEVFAVPPGRVLGDEIFGTVAWPAGAIGKVYRRATIDDPQEATPDRLLEIINQVRTAGGLRPLSLARQQTATTERAAPHFWAALFGGEVSPVVADQILLGLKAGWDVESLVRSGDFASALTNGDEAGRLVASALDRPVGRRALMDPEAELLAVGITRSPDRKTQAAVFTTYALFHDDTASKSPAVLERLAGIRTGKGRAQAKALPKAVDALAASLALEVQNGKKTTREALDSLLRGASKILGRGVMGWSLEASSLEDLAFPEELVDWPSLELAIGMGHRRVDGEPWGRYLILFVTTQSGVTAAIEAPSQLSVGS